MAQALNQVYNEGHIDVPGNVSKVALDILLEIALKGEKELEFVFGEMRGIFVPKDVAFPDYRFSLDFLGKEGDDRYLFTDQFDDGFMEDKGVRKSLVPDVFIDPLNMSIEYGPSLEDNLEPSKYKKGFAVLSTAPDKIIGILPLEDYRSGKYHRK